MDVALDMMKPGTPASSEAPLATPASATAPVSTTASPATPTIHDKPRLGGRGATMRPPQGRSVSQTMALAYAEMANESATSTAGEAGEGGEGGDAAEGGEGGETRKGGGEREEGGDDGWVAFVRSQLVRLFPDFHPEDTETEAVEGQGGTEGEGEDGPPSLRAELLSMRTEIGVLRGIVAELTAVQGLPLQDEVIQAGEEKPDSEAPGGTPPQPEPLSSSSTSTEKSDSTAIAVAAKEDDAPPTPSLDPATVRLALAVVRALDASHFSSIPVLTLRSDDEIFTPSNLQHLLTALASTLSTTTTSPSQHSRGHCHGNGSPSHTHTHTSTHAHDHLNAHEEIQKAHDVSITPEVRTPPTPIQGEKCFADEMSDEELEELTGLAEEAHLLVS